MSGMALDSCEQKTTNYVDFSTTNWNVGSCRRDAKSVFPPGRQGAQAGKPISHPFSPSFVSAMRKSETVMNFLSADKPRRRKIPVKGRQLLYEKLMTLIQITSSVTRARTRM